MSAQPSKGSAGLALAGLALAGIMALAAFEPPRPRPASAPAETFSAERGMSLVRRLAERPHPTGSEAQRQARELLTAELASLGLEPQIQRTIVARQRGRRVIGGQVANILARLPGTVGGPAVLLMAHYDSVPGAPGAGDDAAGVAAIVETVRALRASPQLERDVIVLLTDGEEQGLLGARAFVDRHPWMADVGVVLNFEGRGSGGIVTMFETSAGAAPLVRALRAAAAEPFATSLAGEVYRRLPNDTDFSPLRDAGAAGLNFAFVGDIQAYHTALDTPARLDPRSLQHHGAYALAMVRRLASGPLVPVAGDEAVYFNPFGAAMIVYPAFWALPLALLAALGLIVALVLARRRGALDPRGMLRGAGWIALALAASALLAQLGWWLLGRLTPWLLRGPYGVPYDDDLIAWALFAAIVAVWLVALGRSRAGVTSLLAALATLWTLLSVACALAMPGASYLFSWPALALAVALLAVAAGPGEAGALRASAAPALGALVGVVLWLPLLDLLLTTLTLRAAGVLGLGAGLLISLLAPLLAPFGRGRRWIAAALALALILAVAVLTRGGYDPSRPRVDTLAYVYDADAVEARWLSFDRRADAWVAQRLGAEAARGPRPAFLGDGPELLQRTAELAPLPFPRVEKVLDLEGENGVGRSLSLFLVSPRRAPVLRLEARAEGGIAGLWLDDVRYPFDGEGGDDAGDPEEPVRLRFVGWPAEGLALTFELAAPSPIELLVVDQSWSLPTPPGEPTPPRPPGFIPRPSWLTDSTFVAKRYTF